MWQGARVSKDNFEEFSEEIIDQELKPGKQEKVVENVENEKLTKSNGPIDIDFEKNGSEENDSDENPSVNLFFSSKSGLFTKVQSEGHTILNKDNSTRSRERGSILSEVPIIGNTSQVYVMLTKEHPSKDEIDIPIRLGMKDVDENGLGTARILLWTAPGKMRGHVGMIIKDKDRNYTHISLYHDTEALDAISPIKRILLANVCCCRPATISNQYFLPDHDGSGDLEFGKMARHVDHIVDVDGLDINKMLQYFDKLKDPDKGGVKIIWRFFGGCLFTSKYQNCSSLCENLLEQGGFQKRLTYSPIAQKYRQKPLVSKVKNYVFYPSVVLLLLFSTLLFPSFLIAFALELAENNGCQTLYEYNITNGFCYDNHPDQIVFEDALNGELFRSLVDEAWVLSGLLTVYTGSFFIFFMYLKSIISSTFYNFDTISSPFRLTSSLLDLAHDTDVADIHFAFDEKIIDQMVVVEVNEDIPTAAKEKPTMKL